MPTDTQREPSALERCIEAERAATDAVVACPWGIHEEFLRRKAVMTTARAATDEAVRKVETVIAAATGYLGYWQYGRKQAAEQALASLRAALTTTGGASDGN